MGLETYFQKTGFPLAVSDSVVMKFCRSLTHCNIAWAKLKYRKFTGEGVVF